MAVVHIAHHEQRDEDDTGHNQSWEQAALLAWLWGGNDGPSVRGLIPRVYTEPPAQGTYPLNERCDAPAEPVHDVERQEAADGDEVELWETRTEQSAAYLAVTDVTVTFSRRVYPRQPANHGAGSDSAGSKRPLSAKR